MKTIKNPIIALLALGLVTAASAETKPLKVMLITGGCCHDYATQKDILKKGLEARANVVIDQIHTADSSTSPDLPIYGNPDYAAGYDLVIHNECSAGISDEKVVEAVLAPHKKGIPAVNLHCAMHSYRVGDFKAKITETGAPRTMWFEFLGLQSTGHGPKKPVAISYTDKEHPITRGLEDWTTGDEELYNSLHVFDTARVLAKGVQEKDEAVITWTNDYNGTRVFSTTLAHFSKTVEDPRYLDLVARGLLWATGKLDEKGEITEGYGPKR